MNVEFFNNGSPPEKINKSLSNKKVYEGVIFNDANFLSVETPKIKLNNISDISELAKYNYMRIPKFSRYYHIVNRYTDNGFVIIEGESDPLMSFSVDIMKSSQIIMRSNYNSNPMLVDNEIAIRSDHNYEFINFENAVDNANCAYVILETAGKGGNST